MMLKVEEAAAILRIARSSSVRTRGRSTWKAVVRRGCLLLRVGSVLRVPRFAVVLLVTTGGLLALRPPVACLGAIGGPATGAAPVTGTTVRWPYRVMWPIPRPSRFWSRSSPCPNDLKPLSQTKWGGRCLQCQGQVLAGAPAWWSPSTKGLVCGSCRAVPGCSRAGTRLAASVQSGCVGTSGALPETVRRPPGGRRTG